MSPTSRENSGPPWLEAARQEIGVYEIPGPDQNNERILEYLRTTSYPQDGLTDEVKWCSAFVNWCLKKCGISGTREAARAASWHREDWGVSLNAPRVGCLVVYSYHVGFYVGDESTASLLLLGGNQSDEVNISTFPKHGVLSYRWPQGH